MSVDLTTDRRRHPRRPKLMKFVLHYRKTREQVLTTDVSRCGVFLRSSVVPAPGSEIVIVLPEPRPESDCIKVYCRVVRTVRRGDPYNPLGGVGVELARIESPRGTAPIVEMLASLFGKSPDLAPRTGLVSVTLPDCKVTSPAEPEPTGDGEAGFVGEHVESTRTIAVDIACFCRWRNMILQASLLRLGSEQAILTKMRVVPEMRDEVVVRILGIHDPRFRGLQFTGVVDQILANEDTHDSLVSLALDPASEQPEIGPLRHFLRDLGRG